MPSDRPCSNDHRVNGVINQRMAFSAFAGLLLAAFTISNCSRAPSERRGGEQPTERSVPEPTALSTPGAAALTDPASPEILQRALPYPRGRWRLASMEKLNNVVLWFSHILIRYHDVLSPKVSFSVVEWGSAYPPSERSRDDALRLAERVAQEAAAGNLPFADLVTAYSEDITTVNRAGSLGGMTAALLSSWPQIVDALAVLKPGQTSQVVETPHGFHILQKRAPPPEQTVSGARILIGHDDARALSDFHLRGDISRRSRADAEALALELYERARSSPAEFSKLVERYSEHLDAEVQGDLGQWSTHEPTAQARELETLAQLRIGEVARPIDTFLGFQILMRTADRERPEFAHEAVEIMFNPRAPEGDPESEAAARERASEIGARLKREPELFDALRKDLCCMETHVWREGRRDQGLQAGLSALRIGQIGMTPVRIMWSYAFLRRLDPTRVSRTPAASLELPSHAAPDIEALLGWELEQRTAEEIIRAIGALVGDELGLRGEHRARLRELHEVRAGIGTGDERVRAVAAIASETKERLAPTEYQRYRALATRLIEQVVADPVPSVAGP